MLPEGATLGMTEERAEKLLERQEQALLEGREQALQERVTAVMTEGGERWRDKQGERRCCGRGQERTLREEESDKGAKTGRQR